MAAVAPALASKEALRAHFSNRLRGFLSSTQAKLTADGEIRSRLVKILAKVPGPVALFRGMADEPDLLPLTFADLKRSWAFPALDQQTLVFQKLGANAEWLKTRLGFWQLSSQAPKTEVQDLVAVIVPGLAFDRFGGRLGRGQGYYDRALEKFRGLRIGVGYSAQLSEDELPIEMHDVKMNQIVNETETIVVKG